MCFIGHDDPKYGSLGAADAAAAGAVHNPYDLLPTDSPEMQRLKIAYAQKQVTGQPIYPPEMTRQPVHPQVADLYSAFVDSLFGGGR